MTVQISDIQDARARLKGISLITPMVSDKILSKQLDAQVYLKAESMQRSGSFKIRGAYNTISRLNDEEKARGVIAASAGNHAQGVALAARLCDVKATIVLPVHAPLTKVMKTKDLGAEVVLHGATFDEAVNYSRELQAEHGYTYVHAYDNPRVVAGQGTIGLEIVDSLPDVSTVIVPIGGGGIISGIAIAIKTLRPKARVVGVQSANVSWAKPSVAAGHAIIPEVKPTIADGIAVKTPGEITLPIIEKYVDELVEVTDEEVAHGIFHCVQNSHLVVEGAGAAGVAALIAKKIKVTPGETVCAVLCGGNIDANLLARVLEQVLVRQGRYIMLKVLVMDRPGMLAGLLETVADSGANVIEVFHRRAMWLAPLGRVGIEMLLEVRDHAHGREVQAHLTKAGYHVEPEGQDTWEE